MAPRLADAASPFAEWAYDSLDVENCTVIVGETL